MNKSIACLFFLACSLHSMAQPGSATQDIDGISFQEYQQKALRKTADLNTYLKILCDKAMDWQEANKAINQAVALFVNEDATVQISTVGQAKPFIYKIRSYLTRMKLIKYSKVQIEWTNIQYVSNLRKGPDGNYYGIISFEQVFKGYMDNRLVYTDRTRKNVEVVLKAYTRSTNGRNKLTWDVLLSDIGVVVTKV